MTNNNFTQLINQWILGDNSSEEQLINELYPLLRDIAHKQLYKAQNAGMHTTLVVNELYLKLKNQNKIELQNKGHFLALSAHLVRQIIIDTIRSQNSQKRGGDFQQVTLDHEMISAKEGFNIDWLTLDKLLSELHKIDPESVKIIELRFFMGLSIPEMAQTLGTSESSISRSWKFAKSWLLQKLKKEQED